MRLLLLRHGHALTNGFDDSNRPLSELGNNQSRIVARTIQGMKLYPDVIFSSPLLRAKQMGAIIGELLGITKIKVTEYLLPGADAKRLIDQLSASRAGSVLLVGHEPHLHTFLSVLIANQSRSHVQFGNGTLACVDIFTPIKPGTGIFVWSLKVEDMEIIG